MADIETEKSQRIFIGSLHDVLPAIKKEISFGIEEEGCLTYEYTMKTFDDIRYSNANMTILIFKNEICVYTIEKKQNLLLYRTDKLNFTTCRIAGKIAARYLKGLSLDF